MSEVRHEDGHYHDKKYAFFIGTTLYESELRELTGAQIKARIPDIQPNTGLSLEGHGHDPDRMIGDTDIVDLESGDGPLRFTLVPPATFG